MCGSENHITKHHLIPQSVKKTERAIPLCNFCHKKVEAFKTHPTWRKVMNLLGNEIAKEKENNLVMFKKMVEDEKWWLGKEIEKTPGDDTNESYLISLKVAEIVLKDLEQKLNSLIEESTIIGESIQRIKIGGQKDENKFTRCKILGKEENVAGNISSREGAV